MSITESSSRHSNLEQLPVEDLIARMNEEDQQVALAVQKALPQVEAFLHALEPRMQQGGRLFYIGAGTSGRLGILDASECPPTFGVEPGIVIGLIAGGDDAIRNAVEFAEDDENQAWKDLSVHHLMNKDTIVGIAASGRTPYVVGGLREARKQGLLTGGITCNPGSKVSQEAEYPMEVVVGPEFVTGSTRLKSGTAQKMLLNMISTSMMIRMGRVKGNKMVDMQLSNQKLVNRGERMLMDELGIDQENAAILLQKHGSVRAAIQAQSA